MVIFRLFNEAFIPHPVLVVRQCQNKRIIFLFSVFVIHEEKLKYFCLSRQIEFAPGDATLQADVSLEFFTAELICKRSLLKSVWL